MKLSNGEADLGWLVKRYPEYHGTFYRACSQLVEGAKKLASYANRRLLGEDPIKPEVRLDTSARDLRRSLSMVDVIADAGQSWILESLSRGLQLRPMRVQVIAFSLVDGWTDRWQKYGHQEAMDSILLLPDFGRIAALSVSEVQGDTSLLEGSAPIPFKLRNVHYYPYFNRLKAVKGRRAEIVPIQSESDRINAIGQVKHILSTNDHLSLLGRSARLGRFIHSSGPEGQALWTFGATIGRFDGLQDLPAAGAGFLPVSKMGFVDATGRIAVLFPHEIFGLAASDPLLRQRLPVGDLIELSTWAGESLILVGWPFGGENPTVFRWWPLGSAQSSHAALCLIRSHRKAEVKSLDQEYPGWESLVERDDIVAIDGKVYYVPIGLDAGAFEEMLLGRWGKVSRERWSDESRFGRFHSVSPWERELYVTEDAQETLASQLPPLSSKLRPRKQHEERGHLSLQSPKGRKLLWHRWTKEGVLIRCYRMRYGSLTLIDLPERQ